jgi:hypothetical protein
VVWPNGAEQVFENLAIDQYHRVTQGEANTAPLGGANARVEP